MSLSKHDSISATELATLGLCEQQAALDRTNGKGRATADQRRWLDAGTASHERARLAALRGAATDRRCFIASAVYGPDAPQTDILRRWRDRSLLPTRAGRAVVRCYYALSPRLVPVLQRCPRLGAAARWVLNRLVTRIESRP
ncbi:hypothetical protein R2APBS1_1915 [Rhodanobacter denitrificans]|uniref:Uncharacterized protein n=1 Tax=Rhodanobacter denitrificans TaxID=666685 RepID=M4NHC3_9GAMM|nr:hypothetical protein R2APBS1_1915 [Rhodanobacter denitrificans]